MPLFVGSSSTSDQSRIRDSPSVWTAVILVAVYFAFGILGGDLLDLNGEVAFPFLLVDVLVWKGAVWMLFTSMFLHANLFHLFGNVFFLLLFGTSLEEQVSRNRWVATYLLSGLAGNLAFLFLGPLLEPQEEVHIALGASGAVYGVLGAAAGLKGAVVVIFIAGLDIFAGGGALAHLGGLLVGLALRRWGDEIAALFKIRETGGQLSSPSYDERS